MAEIAGCSLHLPRVILADAPVDVGGKPRAGPRPFDHARDMVRPGLVSVIEIGGAVGEAHGDRPIADLEGFDAGCA